MDMKDVDLNAPAFGEGAQKIEEPIAEAVAEPIVEPNEEVTEPEEESKVPYSRFKKFHDESKQYRQENADLQAQLEALKQQRVEPEIDPQDEAYQLWLENFGDNEAARKAWKNQLKITQTLEERALSRAEQRAIEAVENQRDQEEARTKQNIDMLDENFEDLSAFVGRDLSDKEQSSILDIVDEYTPKDDKGNYAGSILPFDKAWEIYELKQNATKAPKAKARDSVAALTGTPSEGVTSVTEADKNFNPLDWGAYKRRIGL